jgi:hypothetical protein
MPGELTQSQTDSGLVPGTTTPGLVGYIKFAVGATLNNEWVTIGGTPYETDTPDGLAQPGAVAVAVAANMAAAATALAAAINGDAGRPCDAVVVGGGSNVVALVGTNSFSIDAANQPFATASDANSTGQDLAGPDNSNGSNIVFEGYEITAEDVTTLVPGAYDGAIPIACIQGNVEPPAVMSVMVTVAATGVVIPLASMANSPTLTWVQANANQFVLILDEAAAADLAAGDYISVIWSE